MIYFLLCVCVFLSITNIVLNIKIILLKDHIYNMFENNEKRHPPFVIGMDW